jgi:LacI family transcriptional regulator
MGIRIKDIAEAAGVSPATVSLVLNNRPGVGAETRQRILAMARTLEYDIERSNNLTRNKEETIRFLRVSRHGHVVNNDHAIFISNYIDGLSQEARALGLNLEILTIQDGPIDAVIEAAQASRIGGSIILGTEFTPEEIQRFAAVKAPVVFMDTYDETACFNFVDMNNRESVFTAVNHIVAKGHREIGLVTSGVSTPNFKMRAEAFKAALSAQGLSYAKDDFFLVDSTFQGAYADMLAALSGRQRMPTALFCANDIMAFGCIKALKERGFRVPEDISIVGFDNLPASAMLDPPLTTVEVSKFQIGKMALRLLFECMSEKQKQPAIKILVSGELVERSSVRDLASQ